MAPMDNKVPSGELHILSTYTLTIWGLYRKPHLTVTAVSLGSRMATTMMSLQYQLPSG